LGATVLFASPRGARSAQGAGRALAPKAPGSRSAFAARTAHLLDYIAVDYAGAVHDARVSNPVEYREQREFAQEVVKRLASLGLAHEDPLLREAGALVSAIRRLAPAREIEARARALAWRVRSRFGARALPPRPPSIANGRKLYRNACASCHGEQGHGDGPAAAALHPPPRDFTDRGRMLAMSPLALFDTISFGIRGTAMPAFTDRFGEAERYDLAFYVGSFAFRPEEVARGREIAREPTQRSDARIPTLTELVSKPASELAPDPDSLALVAYVRTHPEALRRGDLPLALARSRLDASWEALRSGDRRRALDLAIAAYLEGVEPVEPALGAIDPASRIAIERSFSEYRAALQSGDAERAAAARRRLGEQLALGQRRLGSEHLAAGPLFVSAFAIAAREGLEAVLIVVALCGILLRAGRREALRQVHLGWIAAVFAGVATWLAARYLVEVSGASREVIEGVSSLAATAILFSVSYWMISRIEGARWQSFLSGRMQRALSRGSRWALTSVAFLAVYRELFEVILFYEALWGQAAATGTRPILLGGLAGLALLAAISLAAYRLGLRLPLRPFFAISSGLLYTLAVVLAGQGVAALQEAGWLPATPWGSLRIEWLGIHSTLEGLALQGALVAVALAALPLRGALRRLRTPQQVL